MKFIGNAATVTALVDLITNVTQPSLAIIGFNADNILEDDNVPANTLYVCNPTLALAIGMKTNVRVVVLEVSGHHRSAAALTVGLRDATAVAGRVLHS